MSNSTRYPLSYGLRNMFGLVDRRALDAAADELDRLNALVISVTTTSAELHNETKRRTAQLQSRISELESALAACDAQKATN